MSAAQDENAAPAAKLGRILLVDDQAQNRDMLGRRLERRGYEVITRQSAVGVEAAIDADKIDLVLLDWIMPDRSGHDTLLGLRALYDAEHLPVIVVTALDEGSVVAEALEAGANDYIPKPVDLRVLTARVKAQLDRRQAVLELDSVRSDLERTVVERTQDLINANHSLSAEICERQAAEARAQTLARHDPLTGLANRRHFIEEAERRIVLVGEQESSLALMFVDLDRFKPINDVHGHAMGDELLREIGARLAACVRHDSFVARLGGDEFAILLEGPCERSDVSAAARRVLNALSAPIMVNGLKLAVGASIGIAICPQDGRNAAELLSRGDAAMLRAKEERGSFRFFDRSIDEQLKAKASLETELRLAIPTNDIVPFFQPVVRLQDGGLFGYEVLARWPHKERGMISPSVFIPVAEEAGLVDAMFWPLLARACAKALRAPGEFMLAVNISPSQIRDQWFPQKVLRTLQEANFPPQRLEVEVTESAMIGDMQSAKTALLSLKNQGVKIAIDDFGTGYSSLFFLRELPIDKLKIDGSFVGRMIGDPESATIVGALVGLGRALNLQVIAEGVEDTATADALRAMGCEYAQGYLFGEPLEAPLHGFGMRKAVGARAT
jgi:diguanylate cyclase (GGDEF)-like protein